LRNGHRLRVFAWIGYSEGYAYVTIGGGKVCAFSHCPSAFCVSLVQLSVALGYDGVASIGSMCVGVGVRKSLGLLWQARKRWMGVRLFRVSSGDARVAWLGFGCDPCSTYLGAVQNLRGPPRERVLLLTRACARTRRGSVKFTLHHDDSGKHDADV